MTILDLTAQAPDPIPARIVNVGGRMVQSRRCKTNPRGQTVRRQMSTITGVTVHQMAVVMGKPKNGSKHERALDIPAHMSAFRDGTNVFAFPLDFYLYHGNGFNETDVGIEYEGHYAGIEDDPETPKREDLRSSWKGAEPTPLTDEIIVSFREALHALVERARFEGAPLKYVNAHRQTNGDKLSDPGALIWKRIVLEYAVPVLGLETRPGFTLRDGKPIPTEWDPENGVGSYR